MSAKPPIEQRITSIAKEAQAALGGSKIGDTADIPPRQPVREHPHLPPRKPLKTTASRPPKKKQRTTASRPPRNV